jgi:hypothetical protein
VQAKSEFIRRINSKKLGGVVQVETADKMTDREIAAKVSEHFATASANTSASLKINAGNAMSPPSTKRSAK